MAAYDQLGAGYGTRRRADARIAAQVWAALGDARSIVNVGAGAGSYEPCGDARVVAVEPSAMMIAQRHPPGACVQAVAEALPFADDAFDAGMGVLTVHHWANVAQGLGEMRRVCRERIVLVTWDPEGPADWWLTRDYLPEILAIDRARYPSLKALDATRVTPILIPADCSDGFRGAYWKRPRAYLEASVRRSISAFAQLDEAVVAAFVARLTRDLASGEWARRNAELAPLETFDAGYRLVISGG